MHVAAASVAHAVSTSVRAHPSSHGSVDGKRRAREAVALTADALSADSCSILNAPVEMTHVLNPELELDDVSARLRAGEVVVLRNAFQVDFAEAAHAAIADPSLPWTRNEAFFDDGYAFCHSNVYDRSSWSMRLNYTLAVFDSDASKRWISDLSARDCSGATTGSPSFYCPGDFSLPHSDWVGQRTVAYVWHLSKDWRPEWGGGLYWATNPHNQRILPASFNTLVLFPVTTHSSHFVTPVSQHAAGHRFAFNGWWQASYLPEHLDEERLERILATQETRSAITAAQAAAVGTLVDEAASEEKTHTAEGSSYRRERTIALCDALEDEIIAACGPEVLLRRLVRRV